MSVCRNGHNLDNAPQRNGLRACVECARSKPRKTLPFQSRKRVKEQRKRSQVLAETFGSSPACARCGKAADDAHELLSRARGGSITDLSNIVPLCRACHSWVTTHPASASREGWALPTPPARNLEGCE